MLLNPSAVCRRGFWGDINTECCLDEESESLGYLNQRSTSVSAHFIWVYAHMGSTYRLSQLPGLVRWVHTACVSEFLTLGSSACTAVYVSCIVMMKSSM